MINPVKFIHANIFIAHPLTKFEQHVEKKGTIANYMKCFGWYRGLINYYFCRVRRSGVVTVYCGPGTRRCVLRSGTADVMVFEQVYLFHDYDIDIETDPELIIDAGAHIGLAALYFSSRHPRAQIICLEPEQANYQLLCENTQDLPNIKPINKALWHSSGKIYLDDPNANTWAFRVSEKKSDHEVTTVNIDCILKNTHQEKIGILKIDIEGAERSIFERYPSWTGCIDYLVIETHDHIQPGSTRAVEMALAADMNLLQQRGENRVYTRNGLV